MLFSHVSLSIGTKPALSIVQPYGKIDLVTKLVLVYFLYIYKSESSMRSHIPDHPHVYVCPVDKKFSQGKHKSNEKTPKAILREAMK